MGGLQNIELCPQRARKQDLPLRKGERLPYVAASQE